MLNGANTACPYPSTISAFGGQYPVGDWRLDVMEDSFRDAGSLVGGYKLDGQLGGGLTIDAGAAAKDGLPDVFHLVRNGADVEGGEKKTIEGRTRRWPVIGELRPGLP